MMHILPNFSIVIKHPSRTLPTSPRGSTRSISTSRSQIQQLCWEIPRCDVIRRKQAPLQQQLFGRPEESQ
ncbi:hypothetical protein TorRG33x02_179800 [Trema orientale]|uniref:Uncharacterized protein n=1 Tax=Trema orientale TaxID=63057 RepID=A0A2P5EL56_TREOI|nr:hypothetical protein TorRG33x02_179800 [Trema orientale]